MSKLEEALQEKIRFLQEKKVGLVVTIGKSESELQQVESQLELCESLLSGDVDGLLEAAPKKRGRPKKTTDEAPAKKRGRPRKKNPEDEKNKQLYAEAVNSLPDGSTGTTEEQHERAVRRFNPTPRPEDRHGGVVVGSTKGKPPSPDQKPDPSGHKTISMEDDLPGEE